MAQFWGEVTLENDELELLRLGVSHWGGPEYDAQLVCTMLKLPDLSSLYRLAGELRQKMELSEPLHHHEQATALLLTETMFASRVAGMGTQWHAVTGWEDATTLRVLRAVQRKLRFSSKLLSGPREAVEGAEKNAHASFRVTADALDPLVVTKALRLPPDHTHRRGEPRLSWSKSCRVVDRGHSYPTGHWSISTKGRLSSKRVGTHVRWLLELIQPRSAEVRKLAETYQVDIFCFARMPHPPTIPKELRARATGLGLSIKIDHYEV